MTRRFLPTDDGRRRPAATIACAAIVNHIVRREDKNAKRRENISRRLLATGFHQLRDDLIELLDLQRSIQIPNRNRAR